MKKILGSAVMAALTLAACWSPRRDDFPVLTGPYLGQTPPERARPFRSRHRQHRSLYYGYRHIGRLAMRSF
jgi:hypothetical protein